MPAGIRPRLRSYLSLLRRWNRRVDLVAPADEATWVTRHLLDALGALDALPADTRRLVDVGTGAGLPGLVWALARPELDIVLCESRRRRAAFLRAALREVERAEVRVVEDRAETLIGADFDAAVSRAVLPYPRWLALGAQLVRPGGVVLALLGPKDPDGLGEAEAPVGLTGEEVRGYRPGDRDRRVVVLRRRVKGRDLG